MPYVDLSGLGVAPFFRSIPKPVVRKIAVPSVPATIRRPLSFWRPAAGAGQQAIKAVSARPIIQTKTTAALIRLNTALTRRAVDLVREARPSIFPARPVYSQVVPVETQKPLIAPSGTEYKNTQVQVQAGPDPNLPNIPLPGTANNLTIQQGVSDQPVALRTSPDYATATEVASTAGQSAPFIQFDPVKVNYGDQVEPTDKPVLAGFSPVVMIGLGLLALGLLRRKKG